MRKLLVLLCLFPLLTGCATYNAMNDPVYQAYLRGEISYATYIDHYHRLMDRQQRQAQAVSQAIREATRPKTSYHVKPDYLGGYYINEE